MRSLENESERNGDLGSFERSAQLIAALRSAPHEAALRRLVRWMPYQPFWVGFVAAPDDDDLELALNLLMALRTIVEQELPRDEAARLLHLAGELSAHWTVQADESVWRERMKAAMNASFALEDTVIETEPAFNVALSHAFVVKRIKISRLRTLRERDATGDEEVYLSVDGRSIPLHLLQPVDEAGTPLLLAASNLEGPPTEPPLPVLEIAFEGRAADGAVIQIFTESTSDRLFVRVEPLNEVDEK